MIFATPPLSIIDRPADSGHMFKGTGRHTKRIIVLHHTGGKDSAAWLSTTSFPPVSTHRLINKRGQTIKIVPDEDTAYTAGYGVIGPLDPDTNDPPGVAPNLNFVSLNIEFENLGNGRDPYPLAQMQAGAAQIVEWWGKFGFLAVLGHGEVDSRKNDPLGFDWDVLYRLIADRLRTVLINPT